MFENIPTKVVRRRLENPPKRNLGSVDSIYRPDRKQFRRFLRTWYNDEYNVLSPAFASDAQVSRQTQMFCLSHFDELKKNYDEHPRRYNI